MNSPFNIFGGNAGIYTSDQRKRQPLLQPQQQAQAQAAPQPQLLQPSPAAIHAAGAGNGAPQGMLMPTAGMETPTGTASPGQLMHQRQEAAHNAIVAGNAQKYAAAGNTAQADYWGHIAGLGPAYFTNGGLVGDANNRANTTTTANNGLTTAQTGAVNQGTANSRALLQPTIQGMNAATAGTNANTQRTTMMTPLMAQGQNLQNQGAAAQLPYAGPMAQAQVDSTKAGVGSHNQTVQDLQHSNNALRQTLGTKAINQPAPVAPVAEPPAYSELSQMYADQQAGKLPSTFTYPTNPYGFGAPPPASAAPAPSAPGTGSTILQNLAGGPAGQIASATGLTGKIAGWMGYGGGGAPAQTQQMPMGTAAGGKQPSPDLIKQLNAQFGGDRNKIRQQLKAQGYTL